MKLHCIRKVIDYDGLCEFEKFQGFQELSLLS